MNKKTSPPSGAWLLFVPVIGIALAIGYDAAKDAVLGTAVVRSGGREWRVRPSQIRSHDGCIEFDRGGEEVHACDYTIRYE